MIPKPEDAAVVMGKSDLDAIGKVRSLQPDIHSLAKDCKTEVRHERNAFGRDIPVATVPLRTAIEAMRPSWREETHWASGLDARQAKEELVGKDGRRKKVLASIAPGAARVTGARPVWRAGGTSGTRVYLDCGHYAVVKGERPERLECPWGCGVERVEPREAGGPTGVSVVIH